MFYRNRKQFPKLSFFLETMKTCPNARLANRTAIQGIVNKYRPESIGFHKIPRSLNNRFKYCMDNVQAWYIGVIMKHALKEHFFFFFKKLYLPSFYNQFTFKILHCNVTRAKMAYLGISGFAINRQFTQFHKTQCKKNK